MLALQRKPQHALKFQKFQFSRLVITMIKLLTSNLDMVRWFPTKTYQLVAFYMRVICINHIDVQKIIGSFAWWSPTADGMATMIRFYLALSIYSHLTLLFSRRLVIAESLVICRATWIKSHKSNLNVLQSGGPLVEYQSLMLWPNLSDSLSCFK